MDHEQRKDGEQKNGVYKRGGVYWGVFRYKNAQGKRDRWRGPLEAKTQVTAERELLRKRVEIEKKRPMGKTATFGVAVEEYFDKHVASLSLGSQREYTSAFNFLIDELFDKQIGEISKATARDLEKVMREKGLSSSRQRTYIRYLSSFLSYFVEAEKLEDNRLAGYIRARVKSNALKAGEARTRYADHGEENRLLAAAEKYEASEDERKTFSIYTALIVALDTGMRDKEQKYFHRDWVRADTIVIPGFIVVDGKRVKFTKSGNSRTIPIMPRVRKEIMRNLWHPETGFMFWHDYEHKAFVRKGVRYPAVSRKGAPYENWDKAFQDVKELAGIKPHLRWHDLRRTYGCRRLQDDGLAMEEVSHLLGHSSIAVTQKHYAFLKTEKIVEKMKRIHG